MQGSGTSDQQQPWGSSRACDSLGNLDAALQGHPAIEQAKGMLKLAFGFDDHDALELLAGMSHDTGTDMRDVAQTLVERVTGAASASTVKSVSAHVLEEWNRLKET
ncbi:ANTAR domain-containing protein [Saccharopolyspora hattusasensis]|uniref:ANTAR domain-containing protein n=1 Tax=Saccharopolyspora hattusasensis TaxID=1128679 RepID=UPI003D96E284